MPHHVDARGEVRGAEEAAQVCGSHLFEAGRQSGTHLPFVLLLDGDGPRGG